LSDYEPRKFSLKETALLLGISEWYLGTLESEHGMVARRNDMGKPVYTAVDIVILQRMGVGKRLRRLYSSAVIANHLGVLFGWEPSPDDPHALTQAAKGMAWEAEIIRMLQRIRDEERRRRAREWRG
jgi:hypothetical protein